MHPQVEKLITINESQPKQGTKQWIIQRYNSLTASTIGACLPRSEKICETYVETFGLQEKFIYDENKFCDSYSNRQEVIDKKTGKGKPFVGNAATTFGSRYEPAAQNIYCQVNQTDLIEFGVIPHQQFNWLGASPDGCTSDGKLVEIKCPMNRRISDKIPLGYYMQIQLQLEVCDLDECDFLDVDVNEFLREETFFEYYDGEEDKNEDIGFTRYGVILELEQKVDEIRPTYLHAPPSILDPREQYEFLEEVDDNRYRRYHFYRIRNFIQTNVKRDRLWFERSLPILADLWSEIKEIRSENFQQRKKVKC